MNAAAHFGEILRYKDLIKNLVARDLKIKYKDSALGFLWSLLNPLIMLFVFSFAFNYILRIQSIDYFAVFFLAGYLPWSFFLNSAATSVSCIVDNGNLVRKIYFPREIIPLSIVFSAFVQFLLTLVVLFPAIFYYRIDLGWNLLLLPVIMIFQILFTSGVCFVFSTVFVYFRDTKHLTEILLNVWFWFTPIIYSLLDQARVANVEDKVRFFQINPMALFVWAYRNILYKNAEGVTNAPYALDAILMLKLALVSVLVFAIGYLVFNRHESRFAEVV